MALEERAIDQFARDIAVSKYALPESVHIPVAAKEEADIIKYIGQIRVVLASGTPNKALLVEPYYIPTKDAPFVVTLVNSLFAKFRISYCEATLPKKT